MKTTMTALGALAMFGIASTVNATPPAQDRLSTFIEQQYVGSCGNFAILTDYYLDFKIKFFYDNSGNAIRASGLFITDGFSKYYNSEDPSRFVEGGPHEVQIQRFDIGGNTLTYVGASFRVNLPGQGVIFLQAGRVMVDLATGELLFEAGPQDANAENLDELCTALR